MDIRHITDRLWLYGRDGWDGWDGKWICQASDEYGRKTLLVRLPGERALVWAYRTCRCQGCDEVREQANQAEAETSQVMAFYGVDRDTAYDMSADEWNRALTP